MISWRTQVRKLLISLICLLFLWTPCSGDSILLSSDILCAELAECRVEPGQADLTVIWKNNSDVNQTITLIAPEMNGAAASFEGMTASQAVRLAPGAEQETIVTILADNPRETPEDVSFRFCIDRRITTKTAVDVTAPSAEAAEQPSPEAQTLIVDLDEASACPVILLRDMLPPDEAAQLVDARVQVCLQEPDGLLILLTAPAEVSADGQATARIAAAVPVLSMDKPFPMTSDQVTKDGKTTWLASRISLYSDAIYFCVLALQFEMAEDGGITCRQAFSAEEFGTADAAPYDLFEAGNVSSLKYMTNKTTLLDAAARMDGVFQPLRVTGPLRVSMQPLAALGEIVYYFEYFMDDASSVIHPLTAFPE